MRTGIAVIALLVAILPAVAEEKPGADDLLRQGLELRQAGDLWGAEERISASVEASPTRESLAELGATRWMLAREMIQDGSASGPGGGATVQQLLRQGARDLNLSIEMGETVLARVMLGRVKLYLGDESAAARELSRAVAIGPRDPLALSADGQEAYRRKQWSRALERFGALVEVTPQSAEAWLWLGKARYMGGQADQAVTPLVFALRFDPDRSEGYAYLRGLYLNRGRHVEMARALQEVLAKHPDHVEALQNLGRTLVAKRDFMEAAAVYGRLAQLDPNDLDARAMVGWLEVFHLDRADLAMDRFAAVLRSDPRHGLTVDTLAYLVRQRFLTDDFGGALRILEVWCEADPEQSVAQANRALALRRLGRYEESARAYRMGREANPLDPGIVSDLGLVRLAQGRNAEAIRLFEEALEIDPTWLDALENLGILARQRGDLATAAEMFEKACRACREEGKAGEAKYRRYLDLVLFADR